MTRPSEVLKSRSSRVFRNRSEAPETYPAGL